VYAVTIKWLMDYSGDDPTRGCRSATAPQKRTARSNEVPTALKPDKTI